MKEREREGGESEKGRVERGSERERERERERGEEEEEEVERGNWIAPLSLRQIGSKILT